MWLVYVDSAYRNTVTYVNSNTYTLFLSNPIRNVSRVELVSAFINTAGISNTHVFLDIQEFRTPFHVDARKLGPNGTPSGNTATNSFAVIPLDVPTGTVKYFKEGADYRIEAKFPSRLDRLDRLTISWLDVNGRVLSGLNEQTGTGCILRVFSEHVPVDTSILNKLPEPVPLDGGPNMILISALLFAGLVVILFVRH